MANNGTPTVTTLAGELGIGRRWCNELLARGMPRDPGQARAWIAEQAASPSGGDLLARKVLADIRASEARAAMLELKHSKLRGELTEVDSIRRDVACLLADFKHRLMDIPDAAALDVPTEFRSAVRVSVRHAVETALRDLARGLNQVAVPDTETSVDE